MIPFVKKHIAKQILKRFLWPLPDKFYLKLYYWIQFGHFPNLIEPKTFQEKIQWLKLYNRNPEYTRMVDKYAVKEYVANKIGEKYLIPTIGVWADFNEIDFYSLPESFVLKTTHSGGGKGISICKNHETFNISEAKNIINDSLYNDNIYRDFKEWPYKNVSKKIIAEEYLSNGVDDDLPDYKWYCFNGKPLFCQVIRNRNTKEVIDFYDRNWNHQEFCGLNPSAHIGDSPVPRPKNLEELIDIATKLSEGIPFIRVDLYVVNDRIYFGELTLYPASGLGLFTPIEWNTKMGELIILPITTNLT